MRTLSIHTGSSAYWQFVLQVLKGRRCVHETPILEKLL
uniref:Uncharacterized protein n=1 Tax=Phage sp. ctrsQ3 TaxID=2826752 RepID=A0A8S5MGA4_9VIRU|nr:MAG TPA: hypothetical protein [Phage sp. ctrsQ3]